MLTLAASSAATLGNATVTVSGVGAPGTRSTTIALTVNDVATPNFALSASPGSVTVNRGASATSTIAITRSGGFTGSVDFGVAGLPTGVTATFSADPTSGNSSVLTLAASSTATLGNATLTVSGVGTPGTRTTSIALAVNSPATTPCANPATRALPFAQDGAGDYCWAVAGTVTSINSWNMQLVEVNGVNVTNQWVAGNSLPAKINGNYYIHYVGNVAWAHFEAAGSP